MSILSKRAALADSLALARHVEVRVSGSAGQPSNGQITNLGNQRRRDTTLTVLTLIFPAKRNERLTLRFS